MKLQILKSRFFSKSKRLVLLISIEEKDKSIDFSQLMLLQSRIQIPIRKMIFSQTLEARQISARFGTMGTVFDLDLSHNELQTIPESLRYFTEVRVLDLYRNKLETLPEYIGDFTQLQKLHLEYNSLTTLPESIGRLHRLKQLFLHSNDLLSLPATIGNLTNCERSLRPLGRG